MVSQVRVQTFTNFKGNWLMYFAFSATESVATSSSPFSTSFIIHAKFISTHVTDDYKCKSSTYSNIIVYSIVPAVSYLIHELLQ